MSTKLIFKRVALVTISALGFGILSSVAPASALASTAIAAYVGPSNQTSVTVVGGDTTTSAVLVRIDVTVDSATGTTRSTNGLTCGESITASVVTAPTGRNTGSMADTSTAASNGTTAGTSARSDLSIIEIAATSQDTGTVASTSGTSLTAYTDWTEIETASGATFTNVDSNTAGNFPAGSALLIGTTNTTTLARTADGVVTCANSFALNMDGTRQNTSNVNKVSYYVAVTPRPNADVMDRGAYTVRFELTDVNGNRVGISDVKIDFASTPTKSDASLTLTTAGTFITKAALATTDTSGSTYASVALKNRDGGLVRTNLGEAPTLTSSIQVSTTAVTVYTDTGTLTASDSGVFGVDAGNHGAGYSGTLKPSDGVYGLKTTGDVAGNASILPNMPTIAADAARVYRFRILYGNATTITTALTIFEVSGWIGKRPRNRC